MRPFLSPGKVTAKVHHYTVIDLVLTEDEIEPVMLKLQQNGIEQTSIHNHLLGETPRVIYMHVAGHGDPVVLARSLASALALTKTPYPQPHHPPPRRRSI